MSNVSDISKESVIQRVVRDNALAGMMLVVVIVTMINGIIIGLGIAAINNQAEKYDALRAQFEIEGVWKSRLIGILEQRGIQVPEQPGEN